ncbi:MAG: hypothetical protein HY754_05490 [Nitrospirae bacterium]|nr:hypothetical protein [Nitrospirota bacterium]
MEYQKITISWNTVEGATSYNLYYGTNSGINKETGTKVSQITSPFTLFDRILLQTLTTLTIMRDVSRKTKTGGVL